MDTSPLQRQIQPGSVPFESLPANPKISESAKVIEAAKQFEAIFLRHILETAQKPAFKSNLVSQSASSGFYQDMITSQLADKISQSGAFGLARSFEHELARETKATPAVEKPNKALHPPSSIYPHKS